MEGVLSTFGIKTQLLNMLMLKCQLMFVFITLFQRPYILLLKVNGGHGFRNVTILLILQDTKDGWCIHSNESNLFHNICNG